MKILISGGSGFIGRNLIPFLLQKYPHYQIINLDRREWLWEKKQYLYLNGDLRNEELLEKIFREHKPVTAVINLAYQKPLDLIQSAETNFCGQQILLEKAVAAKVKRFILVSRDLVYQQEEKEFSAPIQENEKFYPPTLEAAHYQGREALALAYEKEKKLPLIILRPAQLFGPGMSKEHLIYLLISNAMANNFLPLPNEGKQKQDWLYIKDFLMAVDQSLHQKRPSFPILNLGRGQQFSLLEIAELILTQLDKEKSLIKFISAPSNNLVTPPLDWSRAESAWGWRPQYSLAQGLQETIQWLKKHTLNQ